MNNKEERTDKGVELFAEAAASMFYSSDELSECFHSDEVEEYEALCESALSKDKEVHIVKYYESGSDSYDIAAEESAGYE